MILSLVSTIQVVAEMLKRQTHGVETPQYRNILGNHNGTLLEYSDYFSQRET